MDYIESGMDFSPLFENGKSVYIEKTQFRKSMGQRVRSVEFISLFPGNKLYFIEAKTSVPDPNNSGENSRFYKELLEKMQHSLDSFISREIGVNEDVSSEFPECFNEYRLANCEIKFLLIINNLKEEWCDAVLDILRRRLMPLRNIWKAKVVVMNFQQAHEIGLVKEVEMEK